MNLETLSPETLSPEALQRLALLSRLSEDAQFQDLFQRGVLESGRDEALAKMRDCDDADLPKHRAVWSVWEDLAGFIAKNKAMLERERDALNLPPLQD